MAKTPIELSQETKNLLREKAQKSGRSMTKEIQLLLKVCAEADIGLDDINEIIKTRSSSSSSQSSQSYNTYNNSNEYNYQGRRSII